MENKEETMEVDNEKPVNHVYDIEIISFDIAQKDRYELDLHGKFVVKLREGKYFVERIKPQYPKTYEECCRIVNANPCIRLMYDLSNGQKYSYDADNLQVYERIRKLLICRDAYWKMAGEQMGLGQPWKPDWENKDHESYPSIVVCGGEIVKSTIYTHDNPFAFPTKEMRDAFKENFDEAIENCKQFL